MQSIENSPGSNRRLNFCYFQFILLVLSGYSACLFAQVPEDTQKVIQKLAAYDVVWDSPSVNSKGSMPLGNGDIAINLWTENDSDLLLYIGKTGAWSENPAGTEGLLKVGRIRIHFGGTPFLKTKYFIQNLELKNGSVHITAGDNLKIMVWVDANHPVIHIVANQKIPQTIDLALQPLRTEAVQAAKHAYIKSKLHADEILTDHKNAITWLYANQNKSIPALLNLKFGAIAYGTGLVSKAPDQLTSSSSLSTCSIAINVLSGQYPSSTDWESAARKTLRDPALMNSDWEAHQLWWRKFWQRSWIFLSGDAEAEAVTRSYILQRYINACAGRGKYAIKYNGSLFTMDDTITVNNKDKTKTIVPVNGDFRYWGGSYWMQNTRHMYWPMVASGDYDLLMPFFNMYLDMVAGNKKDVWKMYGVNGVLFAETTPFYGFVPDARDNDPPGYVKHYYTQSLELLSMMLDYCDYSGDQTFLKDKLLPLADDALVFFAERFQKDGTGRLVFEPANTMETFWKAKNPVTDVAGFRFVITGLLNLPDSLLTASRRKTLEYYLSIAPHIPIGKRNGQDVVLVADRIDSVRHNTENPELYAIFPFRIYGLGKPDLSVARHTFEQRLIKMVGCWHHDVLSAALLGETRSAAAELVKICTLKNAKDNQANSFRFPAFWGPGHDYAPDEDQGGVLQNALQLMLLQNSGKYILEFPAFPAKWDVDFKLHGAGGSTVWAVRKNGKLEINRIVSSSGKKLKIMNP